jgi:hypothetical protein
MSQRASGYERKERDLYETPEWVTRALVPHIPDRVRSIWEPACGSGKMVGALAGTGTIWGSDIDTGEDFLAHPNADEFEAIITNPPYALATEFIEHATRLMSRPLGMVAMLLRTDFDHAKSRQRLFALHPAFAKKVVLTKRIKWFEDSKGQPSFNHAWFIWDWKHEGPPTLAYGPR